MAETTYTYSIANDLPDGAVNAGRLDMEIRASAIVTALASVSTAADVLTITFKDALSAGDKTLLDGDATGPAGGLLAAHDSSPSAPVALVRIDQTVDPPKVHASPRPAGVNTYFTSCGDSGGLSGGPKLVFKMTSGDAEKSVSLVFSETVYIKDGWCACVDAPLGATISAEAYAPDGTTKVGGFVKHAALLGNQPHIPFDTEDYGTLPQGFILRLTVKNSSGTGDEDAAAAFKVIARVEMYRATTV